MFFMVDGEYKFDHTKLKEAHAWCRNSVQNSMILNHTAGINNTIVVSNTFTQEWEMDEYYWLAEQYDYRVYSLVVENRHMGVNEHNVPKEVLTKMRDRFEIKL